ncbi:hypothetical protein [Pantoea stewartii]|uniref:hypothetical protein n=1 Tax=Pantoea stewartii TaxID=66269 RepID=UPI001307CD03|nr:hypothetical protein [Pantoea stewartii]KAB0555326.1 hypothetical protein F7Q90_09605 [Pantoea stewartii subsp. stewartii]
MRKYFFDKRLPKATLIKVRKSYVRDWFWKPHTVRIANAREFFWLGYNFTIRAPWLKHSARALYPKLFKEAKHDN